MSAWSHLPNAHHIDRVIESLKKHHDIWYAVYSVDQAVSLHNARYDALNVIQSLTLNAAFVRNRAWQEARNAAFDAVWGAPESPRNAAFDAGRAAISALIAWDDSDQFLELSSDKLEVWARISDDPRAILLLPAVRVFERIKELETV